MHLSRLFGLAGAVFALVPGAANGGTVVLHDGEQADTSVERARERLRLPEGDFVPVEVGTLLGPAPRVYGAEVVPCDRSGRRLADLTVRVDLASKNLDFGEFQAATDALTEAWEGVRCLEEPLEPLVAHRIHFLLGIAAIGLEAEEAVILDHFSKARQFAPRVPWDDAYFPRGRELYETAVPEEGQIEHRLVLVGRSDASEAWVDGRSWTGPLDLVEGHHLVQVVGEDQTHTAEIDLLADAVVVDPGLDGAAVLAEVEGTLDDLPELLRAAMPGESAAYVAVDSGVYRLAPLDDRVERLPDPPGAPRKPWGPWVVAGGSGLTLGGLVLALPAYNATHQSAAAGAAFVRSAQLEGGYVADLRAGYDHEAKDHRKALADLRVAGVLAGVGFAGVVVGAVDWDAARRQRLRTSALLVQGGAGIRVGGAI